MRASSASQVDNGVNCDLHTQGTRHVPLTIDSRVEDGIAVLELSGSLTLGPHLSALRRTAREVLEKTKVSGLILKVSGLTATDSSGLGELTVVYSFASRCKCAILLVGVSPSLRGMLEMTHLDGLLPTAPDMASAKKQLKKS
jgi:anti-sigma B factor antagonist